MGAPDIKYGDSVCYIQHVDTSLWLTYQTVDAKCARMGGVQRKVLVAGFNEGFNNSLTVSFLISLKYTIIGYIQCDN